MEVEYIVVGQGICGTWLSYYLLKEKKSFIVFDKENFHSASNVSGGLINPVTGRRVVTSWMAEELLPFVWNEYNAIADLLNERLINQKNILVFPTAPDLMQAFEERLKQENTFIKSSSLNKENLISDFNFPFNVFEISPCYVIKMNKLLALYRQHLIKHNFLLEENFDEDFLLLNKDGASYKDISAKKIIYANGLNASQSRYWKNLPFVQNKGQCLILEITDLNENFTHKFGHFTLINLDKNIWWAGSSNELSFVTADPTEEFKNNSLTYLKSILKIDFKLLHHYSALRPATVERRPFVGTHPEHKQICILNGMGSKGCSLAPWFANELVNNLTHDTPINAQADVVRYKNILKRNLS